MSTLTPLQIATIENIRATFKDHDPVGVKVFDALIDELTSAAQPTPEPRKVLFENEIVFDTKNTLEFIATGNSAGLHEYHGKPMRVTVYESEVKA